jgi:hypothetical protein
LSIIGTIGPFELAWFFSALRGSLDAGLLFGLDGVLLLAFAIVLFLEEVRHRLWGAIVALLYVIGGYIVMSVLLDFAFDSSVADSLFGLVGVIAYVLGLVGGVWGLLRKEPRTQP